MGRFYRFAPQYIFAIFVNDINVMSNNALLQIHSAHCWLSEILKQMSVSIWQKKFNWCVVFKNTLAIAIFEEFHRAPGCNEFNDWVEQQLALGNCCDFSIDELTDQVIYDASMRWDVVMTAIVGRLGHMREDQEEVRKALLDVGAMFKLTLQIRAEEQPNGLSDQ